MSLCRNIVDIVHENETVDARKNITKINTEIKSFQQKVKKFIDTEYVSYFNLLFMTQIKVLNWLKISLL
jgi:predicted translin family RNA/ssDNA-binding protein